MPEHKRGENNENSVSETTFRPVNGMTGQCECGNIFNYIAYEGSFECNDCGKTYNVFVDFEIWSQ